MSASGSALSLSRARFVRGVVAFACFSVFLSGCGRLLFVRTSPEKLLELVEKQTGSLYGAGSTVSCRLGWDSGRALAP